MIPELFNFSAAQRGMLPENRSAGMLPWIIAIMLFLTALASWAGFSLISTTARLEGDLGRRLTVQLAEPNARLRLGQERALVVELPKLAAVASVQKVEDARLQALLEPWLGDTVRDAEIPLPALIEIETSTPAAQARPQIAALVRDVAPGASVTADADWIAPAVNFLAALQWLALGLVALMAVATGAVVVMAVRSALNTHADTIGIMHLMGASDRQVATLFERRIARDTLFGGVVGTVLSAMVIIPLSGRLQALGGGLAQPGTGDWWIIPLLALLPLAGVILARLVARSTVLATLGRTL